MSIESMVEDGLNSTITAQNKPETLQEMQDFFIELYGRRNNIWLPGRLPRINLLNVALGDLQDAVRKDTSGLMIDILFARIPARIFCIAHGWNE